MNLRWLAFRESGWLASLLAEYTCLGDKLTVSVAVNFRAPEEWTGFDLPPRLVIPVFFNVLSARVKLHADLKRLVDAGFATKYFTLAWLLEKGIVGSPEAAAVVAAAGGDVGIMQKWREHHPTISREQGQHKHAVTLAAVFFGRLSLLKYTQDLNPPYPWNEDTCETAAENGYLEVLKWMRQQNPPCPWSEDTCGFAAENGHLEVLKWLRQQNPPCPWSERSCLAAAENNNNLEVLKWMRQQNPLL